MSFKRRIQMFHSDAQSIQYAIRVDSAVGDIADHAGPLRGFWYQQRQGRLMKNSVVHSLKHKMAEPDNDGTLHLAHFHHFAVHRRYFVAK
jgi:hypothetical protein